MRFSSCAFVLVAASSVSMVLAGCGAGTSSSTTLTSSPSVTGNWKFAASSSPASASQIAAVSASLVSANDGTITGVAHSAVAVGQNSSQLCYSPSNAIPVAGTVAADGTFTVTSQSFGGNVLTVKGTFDTATKTLSAGTFAVAGSCGVALQPLIAAQYQPISGTYTGPFVSDQGMTVPVSATLTQTTADTNGVFHLTGSATFPTDSCIKSPVVTDSTVTGDAFSATYTDSASGAKVIATGSFNTTATVLTITSYTLTGTGCTDSGHGSITKQ